MGFSQVHCRVDGVGSKSCVVQQPLMLADTMLTAARWTKRIHHRTAVCIADRRLLGIFSLTQRRSNCRPIQTFIYTEFAPLAGSHHIVVATVLHCTCSTRIAQDIRACWLVTARFPLPVVMAQHTVTDSRWVGTKYIHGCLWHAEGGGYAGQAEG